MKEGLEMSGKFTYVELEVLNKISTNVELEVLNKIFTNVDIKEFTEEEQIAFLTLKKKVSEEKEKRDKDRAFIEEMQTDFNKQKETNNFRLLCGACSDTCFPRCLGLYERKYCNGMFECKNKIKNPEYKDYNCI